MSISRYSRNLGLTACAAALVLLAAAAISGTGFAAATGKPVITGAQIKLPVVAGRPAALYAKITGSERSDRLLSVTVDGAARAEIHETQARDGIMRMRAIDALPIGANVTMQLKPGGAHVMLFGLAANKPGRKLMATFDFETAGRVTVHAVIVAAHGHGAHH